MKWKTFNFLVVHYSQLSGCFWLFTQKFWEVLAVVDLHSKILDAHPPPHGGQILSISCSFWEILAKSYVGAPPGELAPPPRGNPGSATGWGPRNADSVVGIPWGNRDIQTYLTQKNLFELSTLTCSRDVKTSGQILANHLAKLSLFFNVAVYGTKAMRWHVPNE